MKTSRRILDEELYGTYLSTSGENEVLIGHALKAMDKWAELKVQEFKDSCVIIERNELIDKPLCGDCSKQPSMCRSVNCKYNKLDAFESHTYNDLEREIRMFKD